MPRGELTECEEPEGRQVGKRLVEMPDELFQVDGVLGKRQLELVVVGFERCGNEAGICELVLAPGLAKPDGEGLNGLAHVPAHQSHDQARVESPAQHGPERHVAHQAQANALVELREQELAIFVFVSPSSDVGLRVVPESFGANMAALDDQRVPGHELRNAGERGVRPREETEGQIRVDRLVVEGRCDQPGSQEGLELRGEQQQVAGARVVQRFDAEPVTGDYGATGAAVPDGQAEHAAKMDRKRCPVLLVQMGQNLGVAPAAKRVAGLLEPDSDRFVVVELAVLDCPDRPALIRERLVTPGNVDDA